MANAAGKSGSDRRSLPEEESRRIPFALTCGCHNLLQVMWMEQISDQARETNLSEKLRQLTQRA
jgi:hypothetical protein